MNILTTSLLHCSGLSLGRTAQGHTALGRSALALCLAGSLLGGCSDSDSGNGEGGGGGSQTGNQSIPADIPDFSGVFGHVYGVDGAALPGATVTASGVVTQADANGYFELQLAESGEVVVQVTSDGFLLGIKSIPVGQGNPSAVNFYLMAEAAGMPLDATTGGAIRGARGAGLDAPAAAFVDSAGAPVEGEVMVHLTPLDPSVNAELEAYPGDLSATDFSGTTVMLESFGVLDVTVRSNGEEVQVAPGQKLTVRIPAPAGGPTPPETIALWSFDEQSGIWVEEGTATLDVATNIYVAEIAHMSFWNCDQPQSSTCISGHVVDRTGAPVPGAYIKSYGLDYNGSSDANVDANGDFCMLVRRNSQVSVQALHPAGGGEIKEVQSQDVLAEPPLICNEACQDVGEFTIEAGTLVTGSGDAVNCAGIQNPWLNTCAEGFGTLAQCFQPSGKCTIKSSGSISWENGSRVETSGLGALGGTISGTYYGPSGENCGSYEYVVDINDPDAKTTGTFTMPNGQKFQMEFDPSDSSQTIICPSGESFLITSEQQQIYQACVGTNDTEQCEYEGLGGGDGGFNSCENDSDCTNGLMCCDYGSNIKFCTIEAACPQ